jgi:uncharacterized protein
MLSRRTLLQHAGLLQTAIIASAQENRALTSVAGPDRIAVLPGKTYLRGWVGYGPQPAPREPWTRPDPNAPAAPAGPPPEVLWSKISGPGRIIFEDPKALVTTASFRTPGRYTIRLSATSGEAKASSTVDVIVEKAPPVRQLDAVYTKQFKVSSPLWNARAKALVVNWIPHCIQQNERTDIEIGPGGLDNFIEAGKALRGEMHRPHKGYVFSNAWVHQTVEAMSIALMMDAQGDPDILKAQAKMREALDRWIPIILAAQEPDGYLMTAFTLPRITGQGRIIESNKFKHWDPAYRGDHEGYVAGYFLEAAINHYLMTGRQDARLYNAAKKLADCWADNLGPPPKKPWYDGHQQMEQGLVRFGRFVNDMEGGGKGDRYVELAKFLLDSRYTSGTEKDRFEYDQSHLPVTQQYEAVGHAVRAAYTYSGMADVMVETHDPDYQSAVRSLWDNIVNKKYYVTGGIGSGETAEGFGPNYSLRNRAYCESCSTCGAIFFQWKLNLAYQDARYVDLYEESMYNALLGSLDLDGKYFYYDNPLDSAVPRYAWHVCPCCVGNIPRTLLMFPTWTYAKTPHGVFVNMFVGSTITLENVGGTDIEMVQATDYPWNGKVSLTLNPQTAKRFTLHVRVPNRTTSRLYRAVPEVRGLKSLSVNGSPVKVTERNGYAVITRMWKAGDRVEWELPLTPQRLYGDERIEATRGKVALRYGPLIYNIEQTDQDITKPLSRTAPIVAEWRSDLLGGVTVLKSQFADGTPMIAVPNYVRMNRVAGLPYPPSPPPLPPGQRRTPRPPLSVVWIQEA